MRTAEEAAKMWTDAAARSARAYWQNAPLSLEERYEKQRELYVVGSITLEDFTAEVVVLLKEGF